MNKLFKGIIIQTKSDPTLLSLKGTQATVIGYMYL